MSKSIYSISLGMPKNYIRKLKSTVLGIGTAGFFLSTLLLGSCGRQQQEGESWGNTIPDLPFATVEQQAVNIQKEYAASIEGVSNVEIRPQISGYLTKIFVDEGDYVSSGQILFKIDDRLYQEQLRTAQAALTSAQANLTTAKINLDRKKELVSSKVVTDIQIQEAQASYDGARGTVLQAESAIESAKININFSTIKAPVSGYIGRFNYRLGSLLTPGNSEPLTLLSDIKDVYAYFSMSENDFIDFQQRYHGNSISEKLQKAPAVELLISNGSKYELSGKIDAIEGQFSKSTGSITLRAKFNNPKLLLRTGNTGKVLLEQHQENAVLFPIASTMSMQDKIFAYAIDKESKVIQLPLTVVGKSGQNFIVTAGIKSGDKYIVAGFERLQTGDAVTMRKADDSNKQNSPN